MLNQTGVTFRSEYKAQQNYTPSFPSSRKNVAVQQNADALPTNGKATDSSVTNLLNASDGSPIKSVIAELEKRRAEVSALACAAEARAQEAEEKCEQAENKLKQTNQQLVAEQRRREFEENRLRQQQAVENERVKTREAVMAKEEAEARLKNAESRIKEAENEARSLTLALAKAYQKKAEAEATARAEEEKAQIIQELFLRSESATRVAIEGNMLVGLLIFTSRSKLRAIETAIRDVEARHHPQEDYLKNLLQKQTAKLLTIPENAPLAEGSFASLKLQNSVGDDHSSRGRVRKGLGIKLKFMIYGLGLILLIGACWGLITAFLRN